LHKRWWVVPRSSVSSAMAPRTLKPKTTAKATLTAAAAAAVASSSIPAAKAASSSAQFTGDFFDLYNDLLSAKTELVESVAGSGRKRAMEELGKAIVSVLAN
jgi:hypothetical protein